MKTADEEHLDLDRFNWCDAEDGEIWYHIMNFWVNDSKGSIVHLPEILKTIERNLSKKHDWERLTLFGEIKPVTTTGSAKSKKMMGVRTDIHSYEINLGKHHINDVNRGFWFKDDNGAWYKLEPPFTPEYEQFINQALTTMAPYCHNSSDERKIIRHMTGACVTSLTESLNSLILPDDKSIFNLRGLLVPRPEDAHDRTQLRVKVAVNAYCIHLGGNKSFLYNKGCQGVGGDDDDDDDEEVHCAEARDRSAFWMRDVNNSWYQLLSFSSEYRSTAEAAMRSTLLDLAQYNWAATAPLIAGAAPDEDEVWRHVSHYCIRDNKGVLVRPDEVKRTNVSTVGGSAASITTAILNGAFTLTGVLLPHRTSSSPAIQVDVLINGYAIDYGLTREDPNRGLWVKDIHEHWYKLDPPYGDGYRAYAEVTLKKCTGFLELYDALVYLDESTSTYVEATGKMNCSKTVQAVHKECGRFFDMDFVRSNREFILQHLQATFDLKRSGPLVKSIQELPGDVTYASSRMPTAPILFSTITSTDTFPEKSASVAAKSSGASLSVPASSSNSSNRSISGRYQANDDAEDAFMSFVEENTAKGRKTAVTITTTAKSNSNSSSKSGAKTMSSSSGSGRLKKRPSTVVTSLVSDSEADSGAESDPFRRSDSDAGSDRTGGQSRGRGGRGRGKSTQSRASDKTAASRSTSSKAQKKKPSTHATPSRAASSSSSGRPIPKKPRLAADVVEVESPQSLGCQYRDAEPEDAPAPSAPLWPNRKYTRPATLPAPSFTSAMPTARPPPPPGPPPGFGVPLPQPLPPAPQYGAPMTLSEVLPRVSGQHTNNTNRHYKPHLQLSKQQQFVSPPPPPSVPAGPPPVPQRPMMDWQREQDPDADPVRGPGAAGGRGRGATMPAWMTADSGVSGGGGGGGGIHRQNLPAHPALDKAHAAFKNWNSGKVVQTEPVVAAAAGHTPVIRDSRGAIAKALEAAAKTKSGAGACSTAPPRTSVVQTRRCGYPGCSQNAVPGLCEQCEETLKDPSPFCGRHIEHKVHITAILGIEPVPSGQSPPRSHDARDALRAANNDSGNCGRSGGGRDRSSRDRSKDRDGRRRSVSPRSAQRGTGRSLSPRDVHVREPHRDNDRRGDHDRRDDRRDVRGNERSPRPSGDNRAVRHRSPSRDRNRFDADRRDRRSGRTDEFGRDRHNGREGSVGARRGDSRERDRDHGGSQPRNNGSSSQSAPPPAVPVAPGTVPRVVPSLTTFESERHAKAVAAKKLAQEQAHAAMMQRIMSNRAEAMGPVTTSSQTPEDNTLKSNEYNPVYHGASIGDKAVAPIRVSHHPHSRNKPTPGFYRRDKQGRGLNPDGTLHPVGCSCCTDALDEIGDEQVRNNNRGAAAATRVNANQRVERVSTVMPEPAVQKLKQIAPLSVWEKRKLEEPDYDAEIGQDAAKNNNSNNNNANAGNTARKQDSGQQFHRDRIDRPGKSARPGLDWQRDSVEPRPSGGGGGRGRGATLPAWMTAADAVAGGHSTGLQGRQYQGQAQGQEGDERPAAAANDGRSARSEHRPRGTARDAASVAIPDIYDDAGSDSSAERRRQKRSKGRQSSAGAPAYYSAREAAVDGRRDCSVDGRGRSREDRGNRDSGRGASYQPHGNRRYDDAKPRWREPAFVPGRGREFTQPAWMNDSNRNSNQQQRNEVTPPAVGDSDKHGCGSSAFHALTSQYSTTAAATASGARPATAAPLEVFDTQPHGQGRERTAAQPFWKAQNDAANAVAAANVIVASRDTPPPGHSSGGFGVIKSNFCESCGSLRKFSACTNDLHVDGQLLRAAEFC